MHDHDDDDLLIWALLLPDSLRGWAGLFVFVAWLALGYWWFLA